MFQTLICYEAKWQRKGLLAQGLRTQDLQVPSWSWGWCGWAHSNVLTY